MPKTRFFNLKLSKTLLQKGIFRKNHRQNNLFFSEKGHIIFWPAELPIKNKGPENFRILINQNSVITDF